MKKTGTIMLGAAALLAVASNAMAADRGFYFGGLGGQADYQFERRVLRVADIPAASVGQPGSSLPIGGFGAIVGPIAFGVAADSIRGPIFLSDLQTTWQPDEDDSSSAWGAFAGYRITRYAAVELAYLDLGTLEESGEAVVAIPGKTPLTTVVVGPFHRKLETAGAALSALGVLPLTDNWSVYARAGVFVSDMKLTLALNGGPRGSSSSNTTTLLWGAGTQFDFGAHWSIRADFQRLNDVGELEEAGRGDIDLLSLGVMFRL